MPPRNPSKPLALPALPPARRRAIQSKLLAWYDQHQQPFPWRASRDPYAAMVAAVAAQQTQMSRVLHVYERWMAAFPPLAALAAADRAEVLRVWGRAGYPRRAANLQRAARRCMEQHDGGMPRDPDTLLALPGVGPFTAAIIRTFGFEEDAAAVDTNIVRIIGRIIFGHLQPAKETPPAAIVALAKLLLPSGEAARWNPALMDYGARVCTPRPRCDECVVATHCLARPRFAAGELADPVRAQGSFANSDRQWRGRIMRILRDHSSATDLVTHRPLTVATLLRRLAAEPEDLPPAERPRVRALLNDLARDGLVWVQGSRCGLGYPPEEERETRRHTRDEGATR